MRGAIVGLGMSELGRVYGSSATELAADAVVRAAADAGLRLDQVDGLLVNAGSTKRVGLSLHQQLGMRDLAFGAEVQAFGSSAVGMVQMASMAIRDGLATAVACVFADDPLQQGKGAGSVYAGKNAAGHGVADLPVATGYKGATTKYAVAAKRHMKVYGTTSLDLAEVAVATREWAVLNPLAQMREPLTVEAHQASRMVSDPLRLFDCCLVSNGAIAVIVTSGDRARDLQQRPVYIRGYAQSHPGYPLSGESKFGLETGARQSGARALAMAGITLADVKVAELYDCFTFTTLISVEDYGFCAKGEGGEFFRSGATRPGGSLPVNTGGGQLSSYYMWGMTPLSEGVIQARGQGGQRQVDGADIVLVSGNGGCLDYHSTLILSPER